MSEIKLRSKMASFDQPLRALMADKIYYSAEYYYHIGEHGSGGEFPTFSAALSRAESWIGDENDDADCWYIGVSGSGPKFAVCKVTKDYLKRRITVSDFNGDSAAYHAWLTVAERCLATGKTQTGTWPDDKKGSIKKSNVLVKGCDKSGECACKKDTKDAGELPEALKKNMEDPPEEFGAKKGKARRAAYDSDPIDDTLQDNPDWNSIVKKAVGDAVEDLESLYEGEATHLEVRQGAHNSKFGSGSDGGHGGEVHTSMFYLYGTGKSVPSKVKNLVKAGINAAYKSAQEEFALQNRETLKELGIKPQDIGYSTLEDSGSGKLAEDFSEYEVAAMEDENLVFRIGAFYYSPASSSPWVKQRGVPNMYVFGVVELNGYYLGNKTVDVYETTFTFKGAGDLKTKLDAALLHVRAGL
jgi:hypothetical protein